MATRLICIAFLSLCFINNSFSDDKNFVILDKKNNFVQISLLDKITSKKQTVKINLKEMIMLTLLLSQQGLIKFYNFPVKLNLRSSI